MFACGSTPNEAGAAADDDALLLSDFEEGTRTHAMPVRNQSAGAPETAVTPDVTPPAGAHLNYNGGPVLSSVKVVAVYWGSGVALQSHLNSFYAGITNSAYFDWLSEYDTPTQHIGRGSFAGAKVITPSTKSKSLTDAQIQKEISKQITAGHLPKNDANTVYMVHFPPGISISMGGASSCVQFCAYHGTFTKSARMVFYGVIPDQGGSCAGGCGPSPVSDGTTDVASHELIESVTDPGVGLATTDGPPLGWYDDTNGEIGDICAGQNDSAKVAGFTVQVEWSNKRNRCVAQ
jgi:hypothetical protein